MTANFLLPLACLVLGWAALLPARRTLGRWQYHMAAIPMGVLVWLGPVLLAQARGARMTWATLAVGLGVTLAAGAGTAYLIAKGDPGEELPWWSWAVAGGATAAVSGAATLSRLTYVGFDSYSHFQAPALGIVDLGSMTASLMGERGPLLPALLAGGLSLGARWVYSVFPVLSVLLLVVLARFAWVAGVRRAGRWGAVGLAFILFLLVTTPVFLWHTFYVHANLMSALYLLLAVGPLVLAALPDERGRDVGVAVPEASLAVAGCATAGLALCRSDGLAYLLVPALLAAGLAVERSWTRRRLWSYFGPALGVTAIAYAVGFAKLGLWRSGKLSGRMALAVLAVGLAVPLAVEVLRSLPALAGRLAGRGIVLKVFAIADVVVVATAGWMRLRSFSDALANMVGNLVFYGSYGPLWVCLAAAMAVCAIGGALRRLPAGRYLLFALGQFAAVALLVHGLRHPGRLSYADSFSRVAFHVLPLAVWFVALAVSSFLERTAAEPSPGVIREDTG